MPAESGPVVNQATAWPVLIAAGAVGSALTMLARLSAVPGEVISHDRSVEDVDNDLNRFAADEYVRLAFRLREIRFPGGEDPAVSEREVSRECAIAVVQSTQLYRDEQTARIREVRDILASETLAHRLWRNVRGRPVRVLETPALATELLDKWQTLVPAFDDGQRLVRLIDPRERTIGRVAPELEANMDRPNESDTTAP